MKESIGLTYTLNFVIVFIVITFAFLFGIMSYYKAFKVNGKISSAIEIHEGYNSLAEKAIEKNLITLGYGISKSECSSERIKNKNSPNEVKGTLVSDKTNNICIYEYPIKNGYITYGIVTYITMDVPIIGQTIKLPVYTETEKIYKFNA